MITPIRGRLAAGALLIVCVAVAFPAAAQNPPRVFENLRVLPKDISDDDLSEIMLDNLRGLGLPRLAGEGCLHCHVGDLERPRSTWDYASDAKMAKRKARVMMEMVRSINEDHLTQLRGRIDADFRVTCYTCHAGRVDPRPLPVVLLEAYDAGGIDSAATAYRALRARYYGADAYDFRPGVVAGVASELADRGAVDDAVALAAVTRDADPDQPDASRNWLQFLLLQVLDAGGVEAALDTLNALAPALGSAVVTPAVLDGIGWRLIRRERQPEGFALVEANLERFPDQYIPLESVAFIRNMAGRREEAFALLEGWLDAHPDHDRARQLLINLRGR